MKQMKRWMAVPIVGSLILAVAAGSAAPVRAAEARVRLQAALSPTAGNAGRGKAQFQAQVGQPNQFAVEVDNLVAGGVVVNGTVDVVVVRGGMTIFVASFAVQAGGGGLQSAGVPAMQAGDVVEVRQGGTTLLTGTLQPA